MASSFPGEILHSRYYLQPDAFEGKAVLIVGSYASGGDLSRLIASLNLGKYTPDGRPIPHTPPCDESSAEKDDQSQKGFTKVYVSASGATKHSPQPGDETQPWSKYTTYVPLISHVEAPRANTPKGSICLTGDGAAASPPPALTDIDVIIFATGYNFVFPFCKTSDRPWRQHKLSNGEVRAGERVGGDTWEVGGIKGQGVKELDETMVFLDGDRSIAFPALREALPFYGPFVGPH